MHADFSELLLALYGLSNELPIESFQNAALALVKRVLPFDASMWGTATTAADGIDVHTLHLHQKTPQMMVDYVPLKHFDTAAASLYAAPQATKGFHSTSWWRAPHEREFLEYLRRYEQNNIFITTRHDVQTRFMHWISLFRADEDAYCLPGEERLLDLLAPHLMQALAMNRVIHLQRLSDGVPDKGAAIADLCGMVYHSDPVFGALLRREWEAWCGGRLPACVMQAFLAGRKRFLGDHIVITQRAEHGLLFLHCRERCRVDELTAREYAIAQLVAKGHSYKEIAQLLARAPATVRNHIQAIHAKLGVGSIAALIEELRRVG
ncbi:helix-turn-helix transcriptional regulator [Azonexus sp. R2A61]|uniref:helix-turn-helix transcriptional regulator n=1 Tax=Azonexus sp. R2A61 TaxID=2744443 RepID=UPI001F252761|nr:helix-turn-helix transcriptional regulator [Azonexus sp. R2A61]